MNFISIPGSAKPMRYQKLYALVIRNINALYVRSKLLRNGIRDAFNYLPAQVAVRAEAFQREHCGSNVVANESQVCGDLIWQVNEWRQFLSLPEIGGSDNLKPLAQRSIRIIRLIKGLGHSAGHEPKRSLNVLQAKYQSRRRHESKVKLFTLSLSVSRGCKPNGSDQCSDSPNRAYPGSPVGNGHHLPVVSANEGIYALVGRKQKPERHDADAESFPKSHGQGHVAQKINRSMPRCLVCECRKRQLLIAGCSSAKYTIRRSA
jgi:hypothetical protein